jgi:hypothetical protein
MSEPQPRHLGFLHAVASPMCDRCDAPGFKLCARCRRELLRKLLEAGVHTRSARRPVAAVIPKMGVVIELATRR